MLRSSLRKMFLLCALTGSLQIACAYADFPEISSGTFEQNLSSLKDIKVFPDNRNYIVDEISGPKPLAASELSARQASKGSSWFGEGEYLLRLSGEGIARYCAEEGKSLKEFFAGLVAGDSNMSQESWDVAAVVAEDVSRHRGKLVLKVQDRSFSSKVEQASGPCVALIIPDNAMSLEKAKPGDKAVLHVFFYRLLDAYGDVIPNRQKTKTVKVRSFYTENGSYRSESSSEVKTGSGVIKYTWRPSMVSVMAGWALGCDYNKRSGEFTFVLGFVGKQSPFFLAEGGDISDMKSEFSLLNAEARFPKLVQIRAEQDRVSREVEAEKQRVLQEEKYQKVEASKQKTAEERAKKIEENKPRERFWSFMSALTMLLSLLPVAFYLYIIIPALHPGWKPAGRGSWQGLKTAIAMVWLAFFLSAGMNTYGKHTASLFEMWITCGIGGIVAILFNPKLSSMFKRTDEEKMRDAVQDAVYTATGRYAESMIGPIVRLIIMPVFFGGLLCPVLWLSAMVKSYLFVFDIYGQRVPTDFEDSDSNQSNGPEVFSCDRN